MRFSLIKKNKTFRKDYMKVGVKKLLRAGMMPARTWGAHAVEMSPTERFILSRQLAAAARKKSATSLSLFMETHGLKVEEELSTIGQKEFRLENGVTSKKKETNPRSSDVETGERASRSSDV